MSLSLQQKIFYKINFPVLLSDRIKHRCTVSGKICCCLNSTFFSALRGSFIVSMFGLRKISKTLQTSNLCDCIAAGVGETTGVFSLNRCQETVSM